MSTGVINEPPLFRSTTSCEGIKSAAVSGMWAAAKSLQSAERLLLTFLINKPRGLSDYQIARRLQVKLNVAREVRASLVKQGFVVGKGGRNSRSGKPLEMWALAGRY